jgi:hypothetical protein
VKIETTATNLLSNVNSCKRILEGVLTGVPPKLMVESFEGGQVQGKQKKFTGKISFWLLKGGGGACDPSLPLLAPPLYIIFNLYY